MTGDTLRSTVEAALRRLIVEAPRAAAERRRRITEHLARDAYQVLAAPNDIFGYGRISKVRPGFHTRELD